MIMIKSGVGVLVALACVACLHVVGAATGEDGRPGDGPAWPQWGGPRGDFKVNATGLAEQWPMTGPPKLWSRPLGEGFSSIVARGDRLFTMYRVGDDEVVIALSADDGATLWEHRCEARPHPGQTVAHGPGPHATPLLLDDRIITIGFTGLMHCLSMETGEVLWARELVRDLPTARLRGAAGHASRGTPRRS
ncbi:MAG: outer membrane protein assembly factor BamB family protein [Planctomycetota bacterium]|jgi:outer membrane protein assembly factor BamB